MGLGGKPKYTCCPLFCCDIDFSIDWPTTTAPNEVSPNSCPWEEEKLAPWRDNNSCPKVRPFCVKVNCLSSDYLSVTFLGTYKCDKHDMKCFTYC